MPCYIRMKRSFLQGLLWLYLYGFGFMALSLEPGFLDFDNLPDTNFSCVGKVIGGYYADLETNCQMFHVCTIGQLDEPMDIRFLCLNGTVFDQETRVCERIDEVDCTKSEQFYSLNLELYGHSQFSNLEENSETEQPLIIKSTLPTTTTTTAPPPTRKTTHVPFYTSVTPPTATTLENRLSPVNHNHHNRNNHLKGNNHASSTTTHVSSDRNNHHISSHHFPVINPSATDIRFNPEEINISLHPGSPPDIRTSAVSYYNHKKVTSSENQLVVTTHRAVFDKSRRENLNTGSSTQKSWYNTVSSTDLSGFGFTFRNEDSGEYTEPPESYKIHTEFRPSREYAVSAALQNPEQHPYKSSTFRNEFTLSTPKVKNNQQHKSSPTLKNYFIQSFKPPNSDQHNDYATPHAERTSERIQIPLPPLPSLPTLTFSSPAPFSLQQRNEQKRYTKDHIPPPRIVVSASASVSDASGKRLNYSLGTIGAAQLFKPPPRSYDEYKDEDVPLDPFYLDVPKVTKSPRKKRSTRQEKRRNYADFIRNDEEALEVLKFLFDWYRNEKTNPARYTTPLTTPLDLDGISTINHELAPETDENEEEDNSDLIFNTSDSFGSFLVTHKEERKINKLNKGKDTIEPKDDYVNDNYEPFTYEESGRKEGSKLKNSNYGTRYVHENEKYHIPDDYVDDNIEPIYFKERGGYFSQQKNQETTERSEERHSNELVLEETTPASTFDTVYVNKERINKKGDKNDRTKDNYLKTSYFYTSKTVPSYETTEFIPTITESPYFTVEPKTVKEIEEVADFTKYTITQFETTTEKPVTTQYKGRRGRLKYTDFSKEKTSNHGKENELESNKNLDQEPYSEILESTTRVTNPTEDYLDTHNEITTVPPENNANAESTIKPLNENLLNSQGFEEHTTGESVSTTDWSRDLKKMIQNIESNTKSVVASKGYKQIPTQASNDAESTTETLYEESTTVKDNATTLDAIEMLLLSTTTEENESTTEKIPITTEAVELDMLGEENKTVTTTDTELTIENLSSTTDNPEVSTELTIENLSSTTDNPEVSTLVIESTTMKYKYDQIPTTIEQFTPESSTEVPYFTEATTEIITTKKPRRKGGKGPEVYKKSGYRHRFSTDQFTRRSRLRKPVVEEEIARAIQSELTSSTESYKSSTKRKNFVLTDYPLRKSVNPTQSETTTVTTPFSRSSSTRRHYFFNCFGKTIDRFYPDLRDCRLFHYCTQGYGKNQLLDLKFVCDSNTFFDDDKLICTKTKPERCL